MKSLFFSVFVCLSTSLAGNVCSAESFTSQISTKSVETGDTFDFTAMSPCRGCVIFGNLAAERDFPYGASGNAQFIRFYYSEFGFDQVTLASPFVQVGVIVDGEGHASVPTVLLGNWPSGRRMFFRAGIVDDRQRLTFFTPDRSVDFARHSIVIQ